MKFRFWRDHAGFRAGDVVETSLSRALALINQDAGEIVDWKDTAPSVVSPPDQVSLPKTAKKRGRPKKS